MMYLPLNMKKFIINFSHVVFYVKLSLFQNNFFKAVFLKNKSTLDFLKLETYIERQNNS